MKRFLPAALAASASLMVSGCMGVGDGLSLGSIFDTGARPMVEKISAIAIGVPINEIAHVTDPMVNKKVGSNTWKTRLTDGRVFACFSENDFSNAWCAKPMG